MIILRLYSYMSCNINMMDDKIYKLTKFYIIIILIY